MKILHSADWHIYLRKKNVPKEWQVNRFNMLFNKLLELENQCDIHIIAGDIFDTQPTLEESTLFANFANRVKKRTICIPGNHEAVKRGETFLEAYLRHKKAINNPKVEIYTKNTRIGHDGILFQLFPYGEMQKDNLPEYHKGDILVTHIRGEVPPHVKPEYDFEKLRPWQLILCGDLHWNHKYKDYPLYYSGSPLNVVFDRDATRKYGVNIIHYNSENDYTVEFVDLNLPKLVRKTIKAGENLEKDPYHHVVYEVTGSIDELSSIKNHELLDKKISHKINEKSTLDLSQMTKVSDELRTYLKYIKIENVDEVMHEYNSLGLTE